MYQQLDLFQWRNLEGQKTDEPGRCPTCLESDNWIPTYSDYQNTLYFIEYTCQTVLSFEDGELEGRCLDTKEIIRRYD